MAAICNVLFLVLLKHGEAHDLVQKKQLFVFSA